MNGEKQIHFWVTAARSGENSAWEFLHRYYYPRMYQLALRLSGNIADAQDLVQDGFITAWLKLSQLRHPHAFGAWLTRILLQNAYRNRKKTANNKNIFFDATLPEPWMNDAHDRFETIVTQNHLYTTLALLPETLRTTMMLRYFSSFSSYQQISALLSVPVGTVRSRLNEAKRRLAESWNKPGNNHISVLKERDEWNGFYKETFSRMHHHDDDKTRFFSHLENNIQIVLPGGKISSGPQIFEYMLIDDRRAGSWLTPVNIMSCGNVSIIEAKHFNSAEHPNHCPPASVAILRRNNSRANRLQLYI